MRSGKRLSRIDAAYLDPKHGLVHYAEVADAPSQGSSYPAPFRDALHLVSRPDQTEQGLVFLLRMLYKEHGG